MIFTLTYNEDISMMKDKTIKELQVRRNEIEEERSYRKLRQKQNTTRLTALKLELYSINTEIRDRANFHLIVTEHAIVRYLERVEGINIDKVRETILDINTREHIEEQGDGRYTLKKDRDFEMVVINGSVLTIAPKEKI